MPRLDMEKVSRIDLLGKRFHTLVLLCLRCAVRTTCGGSTARTPARSPVHRRRTIHPAGHQNHRAFVAHDCSVASNRFSLCTPRRLRRSHRVGSTALPRPDWPSTTLMFPGRRSTGQRGGAACTGSRTPSLTRRPHFVFHQVAPASFLRHQQHVIIGDGRRRRARTRSTRSVICGRSDASVTTNFSCVS